LESIKNELEELFFTRDKDATKLITDKSRATKQQKKTFLYS